MDDLGEKRQYPTLQERKEASSRAMAEIQLAIEQANNQITQEEALELGVNYINYLMEYSLHKQDEIAEETVKFSTGEGKSLDSFKRAEEGAKAARMEAEEALIPAILGDYTAVKAFVSKSGDKMLELPSTEDYGKKLKLISSKMPNKGTPFKTPPPAWQDSRFTGRK